MATLTASAFAADPVYQSAACTIFPDRVMQDGSTARIVSPTKIATDYPGRHLTPWVRFRFGLNGQDCEFVKNEQHW
jgi:hypothetical protein